MIPVENAISFRLYCLTVSKISDFKTRGPAVICIGGERLVDLDSFVWSLVLAAALIFGKSTNFPNCIW